MEREYERERLHELTGLDNQESFTVESHFFTTSGWVSPGKNSGVSERQTQWTKCSPNEEGQKPTETGVPSPKDHKLVQCVCYFIL